MFDNVGQLVVEDATSILNDSLANIIKHLCCFSILYRSTSVCFTACGGIYSASSGQLTSPYFPNNYPNDKNCTYIITRPDDDVISLQFDMIAIEHNPDRGCIHDFLEVRTPVHGCVQNFVFGEGGTSLRSWLCAHFLEVRPLTVALCV